MGSSGLQAMLFGNPQTQMECLHVLLRFKCHQASRDLESRLVKQLGLSHLRPQPIQLESLLVFLIMRFSLLHRFSVLLLAPRR